MQSMYNPAQLQFNLDVPASTENMGTEFTSPRAILFERISQKSRPRTRASGSPVRISALSNHRLSEAMQLAKRDLKAAKRKKMLQDFAREQQLDMSVVETDNKHRDRQRNKSQMASLLLPKETQTTAPQKTTKRNRAEVAKVTSVRKNRSREERDIRRLCLEMEQIIFQMEKKLRDKELSFQERLILLDQDEEQRMAIRHLEQMRKSSRTVYTLQQNVQFLKEGLSKGKAVSEVAHSFETKLAHPFTCQIFQGKALQRVAAAYRGTVRLLQTYCVQLPEHLVLSDNFVAVAALYQEVSRLVRELLLCSLQLGHTEIEEVQKVLDVLKNMEPTDTRPSRIERQAVVPKSPRRPISPQKMKSKSPVTMAKKPARLQQSWRLPRRNPERQTPEKRLPEPVVVAESLRDPTDLYDRPEWIPPSNSPHKNVGPPPLTPLLESPFPSHARKTPSAQVKQVKFYSSTPEVKGTEHDIDSLPENAAAAIDELKSKLAKELEDEVRHRIQPLLDKVEELKSSTANREKKTPRASGNIVKDVLEDQVRDIIDETRRELQKFKEEEEVEEKATQMCQAPSLETLLHRLKSIENEEEAIRRRWKQINYDDSKEYEKPSSNDSVSPLLQSPSPFTFTRDAAIKKAEKPKEIIRFVGSSHDDHVLELTRPPMVKKPPANVGHTLILPPTTVRAVNESKREFERYLRLTSHEAKGKFNPWTLVEELSDDILEEALASVTTEVNGMCEEYANNLFQREFADAPNTSDSSLLTASDNSLSDISYRRTARS